MDEFWTRHFTPDEFRCPCCNKLPKDLLLLGNLLFMLEKLRTMLGDKPIIINSGFRCVKHNKEIGGVSNSQHLRGAAADIVVPGAVIKKLGCVCEDVGFSGIGIYSTWVHVDVREGPHARWTY